MQLSEIQRKQRTVLLAATPPEERSTAAARFDAQVEADFLAQASESEISQVAQLAHLVDSMRRTKRLAMLKERYGVVPIRSQRSAVAPGPLAQEKAERAGATWRGWFDGAAEPTNPGHRGVGALLLGPNGERVEISKTFGFGTSNEAEYEALRLLLRAAIDAGAPAIDVCGDSQLVINQASGEWEVKSDNLRRPCNRVIPLVREAKATLTWIPRDQNAEADKLSKAALEPVMTSDARNREQWGNLTAIGKALGISAVAAGKRLAEAGMREGRYPTRGAIRQEFARLRETPYGQEVDWHIEDTVRYLRLLEDPPAGPKPDTTAE